MPLVNYTGELCGTFPRFPYLHAVQVINRAWSRIRDMRLWSWQLLVDDQIYAPTVIQAGTVSVTQFSNIVTADSTATAALIAAPIIPPIASTVSGMGRQIRIGNSTMLLPNNGSIYNIIGWDGASTLTLDKPFAEGTVTLSPYQIFRMYYAPPGKPQLNPLTSDNNLIRFVSLTNRMSGYTVAGRRLYATQELLNRADPTRASQGDPWRVAPYQSNTLGGYAFEFWPCPVLATLYTATYYSRWPDLSTTQDFPQVPYGLVPATMDLARSFACQWASANAATFPELQQTNWVAASESYRRDWIDAVKLCLKQDDEIMPQVPFLQGRTADLLPMGGAFLQNHDVSSLI